MSDSYDKAVRALTQAARTEQDFAGWLAAVLADVAGNLGSSNALTAGRPGSWEAGLIDQLLKGTVGDSDEHLPVPSGRRKLTDAKVRQIREACDWDESTRRQIAREFGVSLATVSDIATGRTWGWLK